MRCCLQAKAGVIGLTKTVAKEWGAFNIRCNGLAYGFIATRLTAEKGSGDTMQVVYHDHLSVFCTMLMLAGCMHAGGDTTQIVYQLSCSAGLSLSTLLLKKKQKRLF